MSAKKAIFGSTKKKATSIKVKDYAKLPLEGKKLTLSKMQGAKPLYGKMPKSKKAKYK